MIKAVSKQMSILARAGAVVLSTVLIQSVCAQEQTEYTQETRELLDDLALKIQVTTAAIHENETQAGSEETLNYSVHIPPMSNVNLGLELDVAKPQNGFRVLSVEEAGLADKLGIEMDDVILNVNHFEVNEANKEAVLGELQSLNAGDSLRLVVKQNNQLNRLTMTIEENTLPAVDLYVGSNESEEMLLTEHDSAVPEPFRGFDPVSTNTINYVVLDQWLDYLVVDLGRSDRRSASSGRGQVTAPSGTRIKPKVQKQTLYEGNRFYFEGFENNEEARQVLRDVQDSLEQMPGSAALEIFSRDEQLAYWLNLYNITVLNEVVTVYPTRDLESLLVGEDSILSKKLLTVSGIPLSLNDIQFTILKENYDNNPLIMYGLYQGIIGGPNIRKEAYTGATVYRALELNAIEFINSNRGTNRTSDKYKVRKVSSLYARNKTYFPDFNADLSAHLLKYVEGDGRGLKKANTTLKPVINDWTVTDLWGTFPAVRNGLANNPAALMDAIVSSGSFSAYLGRVSNLHPGYRSEMFQYVLLLNMKRVRTNEKNATVTMEELGEVPVEPEVEKENEEN